MYIIFKSKKKDHSNIQTHDTTDSREHDRHGESVA